MSRSSRPWTWETVELASPVDQAVAAGIRVEDVAAGAAEGEVLHVDVGAVGCVVQSAIGALVVVGIEQIRAPAAVQVVVVGAADQPVVAEVAEDRVLVAFGRQRGVEVQQEGRHLDPREVLVVVAELDPARVEAQHVAGVHGA